MKDFGIYLIITKPTLPYSEIARIAVKQGIKYLQLREKNLTDREIISISQEILLITKGTQTSFILNDRVDLALIVRADGVHLGQSDVTIKDARLFLDKDKDIGLSTHSAQQAEESLTTNPTYIGFGPLFPTPTKAIADPPVGLSNIRKIVKSSPVPVVVLGGIDNSNIKQVLLAGARNVSLVRYFMESSNLEERIIKIKKIMKETLEGENK